MPACPGIFDFGWLWRIMKDHLEDLEVWTTALYGAQAIGESPIPPRVLRAPAHSCTVWKMCPCHSYFEACSKVLKGPRLRSQQWVSHITSCQHHFNLLLSIITLHARPRPNLSKPRFFEMICGRQANWTLHPRLWDGLHRGNLTPQKWIV